ncbi:IS1249 family transposase [Corynebacterium deserti]|nr:IS1249 family transposase [Corynebacterium deserti]
MNRTRPTCPVCTGTMRKNGTTTKGTTRWRCTTCGASTTNTRTDDHHARRFQLFINWIQSPQSLTTLAQQHRVTRRTLTRWFHNYWYVEVPRNTDHHRIYDQLFIDGTYFNTKCLLIACTFDHVVAWRWCTKEDSYNYTRLFDQLQPPLIVTTDGQKGALKAITTTWPTTKIQRCLVHIKRNIQQHVTLNPKLKPGKALRKLSLNLLKIHTANDAATWMTQLHEFHTVYRDWLNEKTYTTDVSQSEIPGFVRPTATWWYTHYRHRRAYRQLEKLARQGHLFTFVNPPDGVEGTIKSTTNCLEGGINAQIKALARNHRGMIDEHQRIAVDWWLYLHTQLPDDPVKIARQQHWGQDALAKADVLIQQEQPDAHRDDGRPALYDTGIDATPTNSIGIRSGWAGRHN